MEPNEKKDVCQSMDRLVDELCRSAPKAMKKWDQDAIHDARVATRRLKAMTNLLEPLTQEEYRKPFTKALRSVRRRLGPLRDLDVMLDHLAEDRYRQKHATAADWVSHKLKDERTAQRKKLTGKSSPARIMARLGTWWGLRVEIGESLEKTSLSPLLAQSLHRQLEAFSQQAQLLKANADRNLEQRTPDDPHALRIAGKLLRYTLELASQIGHPLPAVVLAHFKQMQEALGLWHDWVVLSQKVMRLTLDDEVACHNRVLYEQLLDLSAALWRQAEHQLKRFSTFWDEQNVELAATIHQTFPVPVATAVENTDAMSILPSDQAATAA